MEGRDYNYSFFLKDFKIIMVDFRLFGNAFGEPMSCMTKLSRMYSLRYYIKEKWGVLKPCSMKNTFLAK